MKMIKPIVNISKLMDAYDVFVCGLNGVIYDGINFNADAIDALLRLRKNGKKIILLSNTAMRLSTLTEKMYAAGISPRLFNSIITVGEILHFLLKSPNDTFSALGRVYYNLGNDSDRQIFSGLNYQSTENPSRADFLYIGEPYFCESLTEDCIDVLSHSASLGIPMLCVGNDLSAFINGEISIASGAIAEQYAILGGKIITVGKPDVQILKYALESVKDVDPQRILLIGDSVPVDIKAANNAGIASILVSKGIHVNYLGEGYIPDVTKTRELATTLSAFPDYAISGLRW